MCQKFIESVEEVISCKWFQVSTLRTSSQFSRKLQSPRTLASLIETAWAKLNERTRHYDSKPELYIESLSWFKQNSVCVNSCSYKFLQAGVYKIQDALKTVF